jgi:hypothetical protein
MEAEEDGPVELDALVDWYLKEQEEELLEANKNTVDQVRLVKAVLARGIKHDKFFKLQAGSSGSKKSVVVNANWNPQEGLAAKGITAEHKEHKREAGATDSTTDTLLSPSTSTAASLLASSRGLGREEDGEEGGEGADGQGQQQQQRRSRSASAGGSSRGQSQGRSASRSASKSSTPRRAAGAAAPDNAMVDEEGGGGGVPAVRSRRRKVATPPAPSVLPRRPAASSSSSVELTSGNSLAEPVVPRTPTTPSAAALAAPDAEAPPTPITPSVVTGNSDNGLPISPPRSRRGVVAQSPVRSNSLAPTSPLASQSPSTPSARRRK